MIEKIKGAVGVKKKSWFATHRLKYIFTSAIFCSASFLLIVITRSNYVKYRPHRIWKMEGCSIPALQALDESVKRFVEKPNTPTCLDPGMLPVDFNQTHIWIKTKFREQYKTLYNETLSCCYRRFSRPAAIDDINNNVDDRVAYDVCRHFSDTIDVIVDHEFVKVNCSLVNSTIEQFLAFTPKKTFMSHGDDNKQSIDAKNYNILVLGIDAVSRLNFYRTMPKTIQFLKDRDAVDLSGYNKVADNTFPNLIPMLLGISVQELKTTCLPYDKAKFDNCPFLWEWFKQAGYYTALGEDSSWLGTFNYLKAGFTNSPTDYYLHTFIHEAEEYTKNVNHTDSHSTDLCVNDKYFYKILLDYVENLTVSLNSTKLFGFFWEITMSHDYVNYPIIMDDDYVSFFQKLEKSNYLNNTILFMVSDHGMRWGDIRYTQQGRLEERLPFVFALMPKSFSKKYSKAFRNLQINSKRLTSPYDLHATLFDLVNLQNIKNNNILSRSKESYGNKRGISLFLPIPTNRTCKLAGISDHWCTCHQENPISKKSREAREAAFHLVKYLNILLKDHPKCAVLKVARVLEASEMIVGKPDKEESDGWREFLIRTKTSPGGGVFEATMKNSSNLQWSVSGTVSRLNLYGNQSECVEDYQLKLYCFCI